MKKFVVLTLVTLIVLLASMTGCSSSETTTPATSPTATTTTVASPFSQEELNQMISKGAAAGRASTTYKYVMSMQITMEIDGKQSSGNTDMSMEGAIDTTGQLMSMSMDMAIPNGTGGTQNQQIDLYLIESDMYIKMDIAGMGEQWIKTTASEDVMNSLNADIMNEQWEVFSSPDSIEYVKEENVRGTDCYVLKVIPNSDYLRRYAEENASQDIEIDWTKVEKISDLYENLEYKIWIAKDSDLVLKIVMDGTITFTDEFARSNNISFDTMTMGYNMIMEMYDHGMPVIVDLPAEAENAIEISPDTLLGQ